ncbi:MAG: thioredoxin [Euryarchaeota archaeon]|nr:thioredoxin [Euryarchaeota archaeon]
MDDEWPSFDDELQMIREKKLKSMEMAFEKQAGGISGGIVMDVTDNNFTSFLRDHKKVIIDFWAEWCGPCRTTGPIVEELAMEYNGLVSVGKCDTDQNPHLTQSFQISAIPTLIFFSHGQMVDRLTGAYPKEAIRSHMVRSLGLED